MVTGKKILYLLFLFLFIITGFIFSGTGKSADDGVFEITVFLLEARPQPAPDNKIFKLIEEELGVRFKFEFLVGDREQKLGVMIAGGDFPDIISGHTKLIEAGALIPLEELIKEHCPHLYAHYEPYWKMVCEPDDGHFYIMADYGRYYNGFTSKEYYAGAMWIQKAILKEFEYPDIRTLDEYFDIIIKYKEKYPRIDEKPTIGFEILSDGWRSFCLRNPPCYLAGYPNDGEVIVDPETKIAKRFDVMDISKRYYRKLNNMNQIGLINRETFVQTYDQYLANIASGRVLGFYDQNWQFAMGEAPLRQQENYARTYAPLPITYDKSIRDYYRDRPPLNLHSGYAITTKCKDPLRVLKIFDTLLEEKWQKILRWGIEGEDYHVHENGMFYRTEQQRTLGKDEDWKNKNRADALFGTLPKMEGAFSDGNACSPGDQPEEYFSGLSEYDKEILAAYGKTAFVDFLSVPPENPKWYPAWQVDLINGSEAQVAQKKIEDLQIKYLPRLILTNPSNFDKLWDEYVHQYDNINVKAYEDRINKQIQWRLENW